MSAEHTPTPWEVLEHPKGRGATLLAPNKEAVAVFGNTKNAYFAHRACNSYESLNGQKTEMVQARKAVQEHFKGMRGDRQYFEREQPVLDAVDAALAKAEGKS